jgi:hypothetical protein
MQSGLEVVRINSMIKIIKSTNNKISSIVTAALYYSLIFYLFINSLLSLLQPKPLFDRLTEEMNIFPELAFFIVTLMPLFILILSVLLFFKIRTGQVIVTILITYIVHFIIYLIVFVFMGILLLSELLIALIIIIITIILHKYRAPAIQ